MCVEPWSYHIWSYHTQVSEAFHNTLHSWQHAVVLATARGSVTGLYERNVRLYAITLQLSGLRAHCTLRNAVYEMVVFPRPEALTARSHESASRGRPKNSADARRVGANSLHRSPVPCVVGGVCTRCTTGCPVQATPALQHAPPPRMCWLWPKPPAAPQVISS